MKLLLSLLSIFLFTGLSAQNGGRVDFTEGYAMVEILPDSGVVKGSVTYEFMVKEAVDSIYVSQRNLDITRVNLDGNELDFHLKSNLLVINSRFEKGSYSNLVIDYRARPEKAVYFPGWKSAAPSPDPVVIPGEGGRQVWTQGQGKYTSSWLPSFDDMTEKVRFSLEIEFPTGYEVLANGQLKEVEQMEHTSKWKYAMKKPVSSYLLAFVAGDYKVKNLRSGSGTPVGLYYYPSDSSKVNETYKYTLEIFDYLEKEIGVRYPWGNYKQIPVRDFLYAGMENVSLTIFSDSFVTDSIGITDRNYINVNAHELAHHWFGNLVTEKSGTHHWMQEGFATYYALLAERYLFGDDHYYWKLYQTAQQLIRFSEEGKGEALLDPNAGSLTFYEKGAWALHMLKEEVGEKVFRASVKELLETYAYKNVETKNFLEIVENNYGADLSEFNNTWLEGQEFPEEEVMNSLRKNSFLDKYLQVKEEEASPVVLYNEYISLLKTDQYYPLNQLILQKAVTWPRDLRDSLWSFALSEGNVHTRQGVALAADSIGSYLRPQFETLLNDRSYITVQEALMKLWIEFPEKRSQYLEQTAQMQGFADRSLRILWLGLALFTEEYREEAVEHFHELTAYTGPGYQFETRQQAMNMLYETGGFTQGSLLNLLQGLEHPSWQFSRFCRNMLDRLMGSPEIRIQLRTISEELEGPLKTKLKTRLDKASTAANKP